MIDIQYVPGLFVADGLIGSWFTVLYYGGTRSRCGVVRRFFNCCLPDGQAGGASNRHTDQTGGTDRLTDCGTGRVTSCSITDLLTDIRTNAI